METTSMSMSMSMDVGMGMGMMQAQSAQTADVRPCCSTTAARLRDGASTRAATALDGPGMAPCDAAHSHRCTLAPLAPKRRAARLKRTGGVAQNRDS